MRYVEVRRHSARAGEHLSQQRVTLARTLGELAGPYQRVVTSPEPRAVQMAVATGFAVDETYDLLHTFLTDKEDEELEGRSFAEVARAVARRGVTAGSAQRQAAHGTISRRTSITVKWPW